MSRYLIRWDEPTSTWRVYRTGEFARYVTAFLTLHEAEQYVIGQDEDGAA